MQHVRKHWQRSLGFALLAILLCFIAVRAVQSRSQIDYSTGDPLFDRLQAVIRNNLEHPAAGSKAGDIVAALYWPGAPDAATVEGWEAEFGERSDYWELLAACRYNPVIMSGPDRSTLERAGDCADVGSAVHSRIMERELFNIRYDESLQLNAQAEDAATAEVIERYRELYPNSAWVCYLAADHLSYYGMTAEYVEMLELGNSLPEPMPAALFPASTVLQGLQAGNYQADPLVAGSILRMHGMDARVLVHGLMHIKDQYKELRLAGTELGTARGLNALLTRELRCRMAQPFTTEIGIPGLLAIPEMFGSDDFGGEESAAWQGMQRWQLDAAAYNKDVEGTISRLQQANPQLAQDLLSDPSWAGIDQKPSGYKEPGLIENILDQLDRGRQPRRICQMDYDYASYLLEHEIPQRLSMLRHLATFDFEHPEEYMAMDSGEELESGE